MSIKKCELCDTQIDNRVYVWAFVYPKILFEKTGDMLCYLFARYIRNDMSLTKDVGIVVEVRSKLKTIWCKTPLGKDNYQEQINRFRTGHSGYSMGAVVGRIVFVWKYLFSYLVHADVDQSSFQC